MKIRYQDDAVTLYQGEALRVLHSLDDNSFDALITDPPYSSGGTTATSRKAPTSTKYQSSDVTEKGTEFVGVEAVPSIATTAAHRLSQDALDLT